MVKDMKNKKLTKEITKVENEIRELYKALYYITFSTYFINNSMMSFLESKSRFLRKPLCKKTSNSNNNI